MSAIRFPLFAGSLAGLSAVSHPALGAADSAALCADVAGPKAMGAEHHGRWIELSAEQWQFLRGVYAMNPETPPTAITPCWRGSTIWAAVSFSSSTATEPARRCARRPSSYRS